MQVALLLKLLNEYSNLAEAFDSAAVAQDLRELTALFAGQERVTAEKLVGDLLRHKPQLRGPESSATRRLREVLIQLQAVLAAAQCKAGAKNTDTLAVLLEHCHHGTIADFVDDAKSWRPQPKSRTSKSTGNESQDLVDRYLKDLRDSENESSRFDEVVSKLAKDKRIRVPEMRMIASLYLGFELAKKKGRAPSLQAIVDRQALDARQIARGRN
jgi:hypothetical protein